VVVPRTTGPEPPSTKTLIVEPASAVPTIVGAVLLVIPSLLDEPVSLAALRPAMIGARGGVESYVSIAVLEAALALPAASLAAPAFTATVTVPSPAGVTATLKF